MSVLRLRSAFTPVLNGFRQPVTAATLATSRMGMSSYATRHGNDPEKLAKEKARNLAGTQDSSAPFKEGAPGWNEHLASDSEASIKADHHGPDGKPDKSLQDATVAQTHKHHHTEHGDKGAEAHKPAGEPNPTDSEEFVRADRGDSK